MRKKQNQASMLFSWLCGVILSFPGCHSSHVPAPDPAPAATRSPELRMPGIFSHNMVLQQGMPVPIWGWAGESETITVTFRNQRTTTQAKGGKWMAKLNNLKPGEPAVLTVAGSTTIQFTNVVVGEVWICSGQSNMEFPLSGSFESKGDIDASENPAIRLFTVPKLKANAPVDDVKGSWQPCNPQTVRGFS